MDVMLFDPAGVGTPASGRDASALPEDAADGARRSVPSLSSLIARNNICARVERCAGRWNAWVSSIAGGRPQGS